MEPAFDSLDAYRKLEESGMPEPQAGAAVEVVKDAMRNLVTKEYLTAELDRRFGEVDKRFAEVDQRFTELKSDVDKGFAEMGRTQAWGFVCMGALIIAVASLLFAALQYFDREAPAARPVYYLGEPPAPPPALEPGAPRAAIPRPRTPRAGMRTRVPRVAGFERGRGFWLGLQALQNVGQSSVLHQAHRVAGGYEKSSLENTQEIHAQQDMRESLVKIKHATLRMAIEQGNSVAGLSCHDTIVRQSHGRRGGAEGQVQFCG